MKMRWIICLIVLLTGWAPAPRSASWPLAKKVYIIPIREDIMPPLTYLIRRGVKEAMAAGADLLLLDMDTNGGRVDVTEEIIQILDQFKGQTATYVNHKAFSAGAFISVATQRIFMADRSVIGAAAPILMLPGGSVEKTPDTMEAKITSGVSALVRTCAEKNGYNKEVIEAMIDKNKELVIDGKVINAKGNILTLTSLEAEMKYGQPPQPLLSSGTFPDLDSLLAFLAEKEAVMVRIQPTGSEKLASWLNAISPVLLIIGIVGLYIEFKTPGFGLPGIVGLTAFGLYFFGSYIAGLAGLEWAAIFVIGLVLVLIELFVFPGTLVLGLSGFLLIFAAIIMAMVDVYPGMPALPTLPQLKIPILSLSIAIFGSLIIGFLLTRLLPRTPLYHALVSQTASGVTSDLELTEEYNKRLGSIGVSVSSLRPGGKAQFGEQIIDVISQGEMIEKGQPVKIIGNSTHAAIVERV